MAYIIETLNPFEPTLSAVKHEHSGGISIREWLEQAFPGFVEFDQPTMCFVNGKPLLRKDWDYVIRPNDVVNFVACPGELTIIILLVIVLVAATFLLTPKIPKTPGATPAGDPVFSNKGRQNAMRLGEPIEVCYGRNRVYPSLAARPYYQYVNNDQFQYTLLCLGQGYFDIANIKIGDTLLSSYAEVQYEVLEPDQPVTLFPTNVVTSSEAGGQELLAPNEDTYVPNGWVGPFPVSGATTTTKQIQLDVIFPKGLYLLSDDGGLNEIGVQLEIQAREINNAGAPVGSWFDLPSPPPLEISGATTTVQRRTLVYDVPPARYEVHMRRIDTKDLTTKSGHDVVWEGMRGYLDKTVTFSGLTLIAVIIRATNNLNDRSNLTFNVECTRKLPVFESDGTIGTALVATRSIVPAFVDVFRSIYGGRVFDESFFDWESLFALDELYTSRGDHFDWVFRDSITVWEAAQTVAKVGRAVPLLVGSLISMKRNGPLTIPVTMFTPDNIVTNTFEWAVNMFELDEFDSINMEYTDPTTGFKQEIVNCSLPGSTTDNPQDVRLAGCQDRQHAYREGMFLLATQRYLRENITFDTGMEGHIPTFGDLVAISHDTPRWGQAGYIVNAQTEGIGIFRLWLSEPLIWEETGLYQIQLRGRRGEVLGPYTATRTDDLQQVLIDLQESESESFDFLLSGKTEPMTFLFGLAGQITKLAKVVKIEPQGGEVVKVSLVNDNPIIHSFDDLIAPALGESPFPIQAPDLPVVANLYLSQVAGTNQSVQIAWTAAYGAQYYVVQISYDGVNWETVATTTATSLQLQVRVGHLYVRVAGVNNGQGPWISGELQVGYIILQVLESWAALEWAVQWDGVFGAVGYEVRVYDNTESSPVLKNTTAMLSSDRDFTYDYVQALLDGNVVREMRVEVAPELPDGLSTHPGIIEFSNAIPTAPINPGSELIEPESDNFQYRLFWTVPMENDLIRIKVWLSSVPGFDPESDIPYIDETISAPGWAGIPTETFVTVPINSNGEPDSVYWRVALFDVWGNEISTNITAEQRLVLTYQLYNEQAGLVLEGLDAPEYALVADIDVAMYAIQMGTATSDQILLAGPVDMALGHLLEISL